MNICRAAPSARHPWRVFYFPPLVPRPSFCYTFVMLTREEVVKISELARISLGENEVEKFQKELSAILDFVEELKKVDTEGLEEVSQVTGLVNVQRDDKPETAENHEAIFSQAPEMKDGFYKVKAIL